MDYTFSLQLQWNVTACMAALCCISLPVHSATGKQPTHQPMRLELMNLLHDRWSIRNKASKGDSRTSTTPFSPNSPLHIFAKIKTAEPTLPYLVHTVHLGFLSQQALNHTSTPLSSCIHEWRVTSLHNHNAQGHVICQFSGITHIVWTGHQKKSLLSTSLGRHVHTHRCENTQYISSTIN